VKRAAWGHVTLEDVEMVDVDGILFEQARPSTAPSMAIAHRVLRAMFDGRTVVATASTTGFLPIDLLA
jgi:hypothetical protein